ncbi:MAG: DUF2185 domain-containing protein [Polyangiaceae bacterium]
MSAEKKYKLRRDQIRALVPRRGACLATDAILVHGAPVGFMFRAAPRDEVDSGWHFFSGYETQAYVDDPSNMALYDVNTVANYDPTIIPFLDAPPGSAFERDDEVGFVPVPYPDDPDDA